DNISAPSFIEENLSCDTKMITCTDSEDASSDKMSGLIAIQPLDRNQVTEQTLKHELSRSISSVASVKLHDESILNNTIEGSTQRLAYWIDEAMRMADGKTKDKTARSMIYKDMLKRVRIDRIKLVTCNASDISRLTNTKIQNIIDYVNGKTVTNGNDQSHVISKPVTI
ncbi:12918_t:CDS:2, partial [Funneliformis geosporum]